MAGSVRTDKQDGVGIVVFDHPERRNAITVDMWRQIPEAIEELDADDQVRVLVLRGAGDVAFVAGADISQFGESRSGGASADYDKDNQRAFDAIAGAAKPVLAMIHGFCVGGGVAIALSADMRYAADDAQFGIPAARLGLGYPMAGVETLQRLVGSSRAKEIFFTARRFGAEQALQMGLVNAVHAKAELEAKVLETAAMIAQNAPLTIRAVKLAVAELQKPAAARDDRQVQRAIAACYDSTDYREGVAAFLEKRKPRFSGV